MMRAVFRAILERSKSRAFRQSLLLIVVAELVVIILAWRLLDFNTNLWIHDKTARMAQVSQKAATQADWSQIDRIPSNPDSALSKSYANNLEKLSNRYFHHMEGSVYIAVVRGGDEYDLNWIDKPPFGYAATANEAERAAYKTGMPTFTSVPVIDESGTYVAGYTPILRNGRTIALVAAEYDSASLADFKDIVGRSFWLSIIPAAIAALVVAYIIGSIFPDPAQVVREIDETQEALRAQAAAGIDDASWNKLRPREKEVANLLIKGLTVKEMARELGVKPSTIASHLKGIRERVGWSKDQAMIQALARRMAAFPA